MRKWILGGIIIVVCLIGCSKVFKIEVTTPLTIEGVVLEIDEVGKALISQKELIVAEDLKKSYDEWMEGDYDLIHISNLEGAQVGMRVHVTLEGGITEVYPASAKASRYEVLEIIDLKDQSAGQIIIESEEPYHEELLNIFPKTLGLTQVFNGYAEYGHIQKLTKVEEKGASFELIFSGQMMDGIGDYEHRLFEVMYEVNNQCVVERISNHDQYNRFKDESLLNSIIPNKVVLKTPLEVGNSWIEIFSYEGKDYTAKTSIVRIEVNEEGNKEYETLTLVEGIEDYYLNTYKESRVFVQGSGMISFSNLFSFDEVGVDYEVSEQSEDLYIFGFGLTRQEVSSQ